MRYEFLWKKILFWRNISNILLYPRLFFIVAYCCLYIYRRYCRSKFMIYVGGIMDLQKWYIYWKIEMIERIWEGDSKEKRHWLLTAASAAARSQCCIFRAKKSKKKKEKMDGGQAAARWPLQHSDSYFKMDRSITIGTICSCHANCLQICVMLGHNQKSGSP